MKLKNLFIPLEKTTDFKQWLFPNKADGGIIPPSRILVRGWSSLTGFIILVSLAGCAPRVFLREITIYTNPPGAMVKVNGMPAGYAPLKYPVRIDNIGGNCMFAGKVWMPCFFDIIASPKFKNPPGISKTLYTRTLILAAKDILALRRPAVYLDLTRKPVPK